jgi:hypothetical protein
MLKILRYMTKNWCLCVNAIVGVLKNQTKNPAVFAVYYFVNLDRNEFISCKLIDQVV